MTKESKYSIDRRIIFKESFNSEFCVRRNSGVPTNVFYSNGLGRYNGTSSKTDVNKNLNGTYSVRIKFCNYTKPSFKWLLNVTNHPLGTTGYIGSNTADEFTISSGTKYVNGTEQTSYSFENEKFYDIVVSGITLVGNAFTISSSYSSEYYETDMDLIEIYEGTLTAEEIFNLYNKSTYHELPDKIDENTYKILDVSALQGPIEDRIGNTLTLTDLTTKKINSGIYSPSFNGSTSKIGCGNFDDLTSDITILTWINPNSLGEGTLGNYARILDNDSLRFFINSINDKFTFTSNNFVNSTYSANNSFILNTNTFIAVTRTVTGLVTFYINGEQNGTPLQNSGTPITGSDICIGNDTTSNRTFDGEIPQLIIYKGILSDKQITQFYTNTKRYYE